MRTTTSLLFGITEFNLDKLQRLQNRAARLLLGVDRRESASPLLTQLHWLPVRQRINFKIALIIFKCLHHTAPQYLDYCIQLRVSGRPGLRSGSDGTLLSEPRSQNTSTDKAFTILEHNTSPHQITRHRFIVQNIHENLLISNCPLIMFCFRYLVLPSAMI